MKNSLSRQYELTKKKMNIFINSIGEIFGFEASGDTPILHNNEILPGHRHIDATYGEGKDGGVVCSFGCSAKKLNGKSLVEAFIKVKDVKNKDFRLMAYHLIREASFNWGDCNPNYECGLFSGYEYLVFDNEDMGYHKKTPYWGLFIAPAFKKTIEDVGEVEFYQLIPAYKNELVFLETKSGFVGYQSLCEEMLKKIENRQFLDEIYDELTEEEMNEILRSMVE